ncbi:hypothetical protein Stuart_27 [Providencia phage vB_PstP_PS3]|uniref:Uncharacterized protein n=1 Tax=Providencia phage vB_PstP_PS3 TaxID=2848038 RepID=A0A411AWE1_9CAUD|nr:hypothetical protein HOV05_gp27 [Providencia phage vB_PstP_PS3]QAX92427.1 hypothetical protein Stuart_27 [Providencia phage vB_PstP_PS3]
MGDLKGFDGEEQDTSDSIIREIHKVMQVADANKARKLLQQIPSLELREKVRTACLIHYSILL